MNRVGIGGFQLVDVASGNGQVVEPKINFGTEEWYHAVLPLGRTCQAAQH